MTTTTTRPKRKLRSRIRAIKRAMQELEDAAGEDVEALAEIIELDGEWIRWIKDTIEPRFHN